MSDLNYYIASAADHHDVVELLRELIDELDPGDGNQRIKERLDGDIRAAFNSSDVRIFAVRNKSRIIGLSRVDILHRDPIFRLRDDSRCGYIDQMFVRQGFRDLGVGAELLRLCEEWLRSQKVAHVLLHAAPKALRFYSRLGYLPNREMFKRL